MSLLTFIFNELTSALYIRNHSHTIAQKAWFFLTVELLDPCSSLNFQHSSCMTGIHCSMVSDTLFSCAGTWFVWEIQNYQVKQSSSCDWCIPFLFNGAQILGSSPDSTRSKFRPVSGWLMGTFPVSQEYLLWTSPSQSFLSPQCFWLWI